MNKLFPAYSAAFFTHIASAHPSPAVSRSLDRIESVMRDKYRLVDKFTMLATTLARRDADADIDTFAQLKASRDELSHGQDAVEAVQE